MLLMYFASGSVSFVHSLDVCPSIRISEISSRYFGAIRMFTYLGMKSFIISLNTGLTSAFPLRNNTSGSLNRMDRFCLSSTAFHRIRSNDVKKVSKRFFRITGLTAY